MKAAAKGALVCFSLGILAVLAAAGFGGCENPWMKEAVAPLYKNKDGGNNDNGGGGYPFTTPAQYRYMVSLSGETIYRGRRVWYFISFRPDGNVKSLSHSEVRDHLCGLYPIR